MPLAELVGLHRDLDSLFGHVLGGETVRPQALNSFTPAAEARRDVDKWMVSVAIPGISPDKVEIDVVGATLRVCGERAPEPGDEAQPIFSEVRYGRFEREFTLPEEIDVDHVQATYRHGMLDLVLPLKDSAKPRRIEIQAAPETEQLRAA
jgi:HSP20 family protein